MILNKNDLLYYLECDRISLNRRRNYSFVERIKRLIVRDEIWYFQKVLRRTEYYTNIKKNTFQKILYLHYYLKLRKISIRLGFSIPVNVFGPGLSIAHYGTIIVNKGAKVGANCRLHANVNIGTAAGDKHKAPRLGDNIYIGPGAKIFGSIVLANNIAIGANAVVNKSFDEENIMIAGVPAKRVQTIDVSKILILGTEQVKI